VSVDRFLRKRASLGTILPSVAGPTLGGLAGRAIGARYKAPDLGAALGAMTGGIGGGLVREAVEDAQAQAQGVPPGAPYALDATSADIPAWALQGAQLLQPAMKAAHVERDPASDILKGEIPGYPVVEDALRHGPGAGARTFGGMALGGVGGGALGMGAGYGIEKLLGHQVNVPGIGMSLPDLLASIGGTIGSTKGYRYMKA
jgi:hypothetical protein